MKTSPASPIELVDTTEFSVTVKDTQCQHRNISLNEDQFIVRPSRGDLIVIKGNLHQLRLAEYCIHHQQRGGQVEVTARGCVSIPDVPRCCDIGEHMVNGNCVEKKNNVMPFNPPLATGMRDDNGLAAAHFPWPDRREHIFKPICEPGNVIKKIQLDGQKSYLIALPKYVLLTWLHPGNNKRQHGFKKQYCVDIPGDDGSYYAYNCQIDYERYCKGKICSYKCCSEGQAISRATLGCVQSEILYKKPFPSTFGNVETFISYPTNCEPISEIQNFNKSQILQDGTLIHRNNKYSFNKFCTETFIGDSSAEQGALGCTQEIQETTWHYIRKKLFPVCYGMSCAFLALLLLLHAWVPKLRENEGTIHLFHAGSLFVAYSMSLISKLQVAVEIEKSPRGCEAMAFIMYFGFMTAFFWINTMCFDMWRLFRNLARDMSTTESAVAAWKYILYAVGGPLIIVVVTIIIQFEAPTDDSIPGLVHPGIGLGRCWFKSNKELMAYYEGPIAVLFLMNFLFIAITYHYFKIICQEDLNSANGPSEYTIAGFWQQFYLLILVAGLWLTEILSFSTKYFFPNSPEELWAPTDIMNSLQGVLVFFVFLTHHRKRALLKEKLPELLEFTNVWINHTREAQREINHRNNMFSMNLSPSSILSQKQEDSNHLDANDRPGPNLPQSHQNIAINQNKDSTTF
ncbi:unnamed protein product [Meganyctiphanes norvegica]|uniref:G-protein coupled receptors family 2 profile 2 domain-containing protein n=1 Tax=Meganyctiphanes norvegica TaxID=48144 RepID=A0AAV2QP69_MEGNR